MVSIEKAPMPKIAPPSVTDSDTRWSIHRRATAPTSNKRSLWRTNACIEGGLDDLTGDSGFKDTGKLEALEAYFTAANF
jgi:hypothetical protein